VPVIMLASSRLASQQAIADLRRRDLPAHVAHRAGVSFLIIDCSGREAAEVVELVKAADGGSRPIALW
jgi:hypothetical protein